MKNNKKLTIPLIFIVLILWSYIGYTIITKSNGNNDVIIENQLSLPGSLVSERLNEVDTFSLQLNYRDPFLGNRKMDNDTLVIRPVKTIIKTQPERLVKVEPYFEWPEIVYYGRIVNQTSNKYVACLKVSGKSYMATINSKVNDIKIEHFSADSILLMYQNNKRTFVRSSANNNLSLKQ